MGTLVALAATLFTKKGPYLLYKKEGHQVHYFSRVEVQPRGMLGLRPKPVFSLVRNQDQAARFNTLIGAWWHLSELRRYDPHAENIKMARHGEAITPD